MSLVKNLFIITSINFLCWNSWPLPIVPAKIYLFPSHDHFCGEVQQLYLLSCSILGKFTDLITDWRVLSLPLLAAALPGKPRVKILQRDWVKLGWTAESAYAQETWQQTTCHNFCWRPNWRLSITSISITNPLIFNRGFRNILYLRCLVICPSSPSFSAFWRKLYQCSQTNIEDWYIWPA